MNLKNSLGWFYWRNTDNETAFLLIILKYQFQSSVCGPANPTTRTLLLLCFNWSFKTLFSQIHLHPSTVDHELLKLCTSGTHYSLCFPLKLACSHPDTQWQITQNNVTSHLNGTFLIQNWRLVKDCKAFVVCRLLVRWPISGCLKAK